MATGDIRAGNTTDPNPVEWRDVDQSTDPASFVRSLERHGTNESPATAALERRSRLIFDMLGVGQGQRVLDVGCGLGDDVRTLAQIVGKSGRAVGVDSSEAMISEARKRLEGLDLPVEFHLGSIYRLEFPAGHFDCCQSVRTFQHLDDPRQGLAELVRVVRTGGRIVVNDPDWETLVVDSPDRAITRKILNFRADSTRNGWMGRQWFSLFREAGLTDIAVEPSVRITTDYAGAGPDPERLRGMAERAQEAGIVTAVEVARWIASLQEAGRIGRFFFAATTFIVAGRKP